MSKIIFNKIIAKLERLDEYLSYLLVSALIGIGSFRNILVHDYENIDREIVYQKLQKNLDNLKNFKKETLKFLPLT